MQTATQPRPAPAAVPDPGTEIARIDRIFEEQMRYRAEVARTGARERRAKLKRLLDALLRNESRIYAALHSDFRKPPTETDLSEIYVIINEIRHARKELGVWMMPETVAPTLAMATTTSQIHHEPKGVVLILAPWNYPLNLTFGPLVSAIAAGNCAMVKPSEYTPATAAVMKDILAEVFEEREVALLQGERDVAEALLAKPFHHIFFTGSPAVGKIVMAAAAKHLTTVTLELGGKSPAVVDRSVNMSDATAKIAWGKFTNNGQTCIAPDYILVHEERHDEFVSSLVDRIKKFYGETEAERKASDSYARIISDRHHQRLDAMVKDAVAKGARVAIGGESDPAERYLPPTVLTDVPLDSEVMQDEIFGPILPVLRYSNLDDALAMINERDKPLALYVFGKKRRTIDRILAETTAGGSCVNDTLLHYLHANLPFGGVNTSGFGKSHGHFGFKAFSNDRAVLRHHGLSPVKLMYPPYTKLSRTLVGLLKKFA